MQPPRPFTLGGAAPIRRAAPATPSQRCLLICTAKKRGTKRHVPPDPPSTSSAPPPNGTQPKASSRPPPPPRRILDTSRLGLRTQLRLVRAVKAARGFGGAADPTPNQPLTQPPPPPKVPTAFRRKKLSAEERAEAAATEAAAAAAAEGAAAKAARASVRGLYGTWRSANPPVLLVDGYNILFAWLGEDDEASKVGAPERERKAVARSSVGAGRAELTLRLTNYMHCARVRTVIAWDAMGRGGGGGGGRSALDGGLPGLPGPLPGPPLVGGAGPSAPNPTWAPIPGVTAETAPGGLEVVWCTGTDADAFLMRAAALLRQKGAPAVVVASSDTEVQDSSLRPGASISFTPAASFLREVRWALAQSDSAADIVAAVAKARVAGLRASVRPAEAGALGALRRRLVEQAVAAAAAEKEEKEGSGGVGRQQQRQRRKAKARMVAAAAAPAKEVEVEGGGA